MNPRRVASFVDAILSDRPPGTIKGPVDADVMRATIAMRPARPGEGVPDEGFVARLRHDLAREVAGAETTIARPMVTRRARLMVGAAAVVTMLGGTVAATTTVDHALAAAKVSPVTHGQLVRMGTFTSADGHAVGQIVAYRGDPSWVFMSFRDPDKSGTVRCQIQMDNGHTAATGTFVVYKGVGQWARPVSLDISRIRGATLVTPEGSALATASFRAV